ncbi:MAG: hypothetical protein DYG92_07710 [Leptolyngbya sp. PLA1]|nr:hypothetical protein [Leptolyngbya sp. PLA1]
MFEPHTQPALWPPDIPASRLASRIRTDDPAGCSVAILGLPDDLGIRLNAGRPGAAQGPDAFRAALARYGVAEPLGWAWPLIFDAGNVIPAPGHDAHALAETHRRVSLVTRDLLSRGLFPIAIGGGHDLTFPFVRAVIEHEAAHGRTLDAGLYFDAHLDVREQPGSGMPFRRLVEDCALRQLHLVGFSPFVNTAEHARWFRHRGGSFLPATRRAIREATPDADRGRFVSLDIDVITAAAAPGVSAANPAGLSPRRLASLLDVAMRLPGVRCFDIMELSPPHDESGRTARTAAHLFLVALRALASRGLA